MPFQSHYLGSLTLSLLLLLNAESRGQTTERVSLDTLGMEGDDSSTDPSFSADGRFVTFESYATNLVPSDVGGHYDVFLHDRQLGVTTLVSVSSFDLQGDQDSYNPSISADGKIIAWESYSSNLVPTDTNGLRDIFVRDLQTGITERVSLNSAGAEGYDHCERPSISADGRFVAFDSFSDNLVPGDTNYHRDIFVRDRQTDVTLRVSVDSFGLQGNSSSSEPSISADGRYVAFISSADNLVPGDTNSKIDTFVHDLQTGATERMSVDSFGTQANGDSYYAPISADGRQVVFESGANNLVPNDSNEVFDIFVHDLQTGVTERVSVDSIGVQGDDDSHRPSLSSNGRYVAFYSDAENLVPGDSNQTPDVFVHDRQTGVTERVSADSFGAPGDSNSLRPAFSADGRLVAFDSNASNLAPADTNGAYDIFVHDRWDGLGANSIFLTGPSTSPVLAPLNFSWQSTRGNSRYWLASSLSNSGSVLGGHEFDLSPILQVIATGTNATNGLGNFTSTPVPTSAAGRTLYFEVAAQDAAGILYDSNALAVTIF